MAGTKRTRAAGKAAPVSEEYVSDDGFVASDSDGPASKKAKTAKAKPAAKAAGKTASQEEFHELSSGKTPRRVNVSEFKGKQLVNIREYYEKDGEYLPGKKVPNQPNLTDLTKQLQMLSGALKGISLTKEQFAELLKALPDIKKALGYPDEEEDEAEDKKRKKEDGIEGEEMQLTKQEKMEVKLKRNHPNTFVTADDSGKLYFFGECLRKDFAFYEGSTADFIEENKDDIEMYDEKADGPAEDYGCIMQQKGDS